MREPRFYEAPSCATVGGDFWFPDMEKESITQAEAAFAKSICRMCPHKPECAEWGVVNETHGIWGGLSPRDRSSIRRQRKLKGQNVA
jgi:hypothetical protein